MKSIKNRLFTSTVFVSLVILSFASSTPAYPPDPDNAALLYYQGFLTLAELNEEARDHIQEVAKGEAEPDGKVREDIGKCIGAIQFAEAAAQVPACNWGFRYSQGFDALMPQLAQMKFLTYVLIADARIRASDGDHKRALEQCLMTCTFAHHLGDDTLVSYLVSLSVRNMAYNLIRDVLGQAGSDAELLKWLRTEFAISSVDSLSPANPLKTELEIVTNLMQMDNIVKLAQIMADSDEKKLAEIINKANKEILEKAMRIYSERVKSAMTVFSTPMRYEQAHSQLKKTTSNLDSNDPAEASAGALIPALARILTLKVRSETHANAIKVAIEVLHRRVKTGQLPDSLPTGLPGDLFSGKDFKYEKTTDGFILLCRGKDLDKDETYKYEFKVKK
jgi:hypothetical protein